MADVTFGDHSDSGEDERGLSDSESEPESVDSSDSEGDQSSIGSSDSEGESVDFSDTEDSEGCTDDSTSASSSDSEGSSDESVLSSSTWTTESGSSSDSECDRRASKLSKLKEFHTPLYEGADLTILDSYLLLYQFSLRHCITQTAFSELISLVDTHVPKDAKSVTSLYKLRKFFETNFNDLGSQLYNYCAKCHRLLEGDLEPTVCPNGCGGDQVNKFLYVPIRPQLKKKLEGE